MITTKPTASNPQPGNWQDLCDYLQNIEQATAGEVRDWKAPQWVVDIILSKRPITELRNAVTKWLSIPDEDADMIDFTFAVYKSHEISGDPLWGITIDASGAGKTELVRPLRKRPDTYFLSKLTEKTLISGYRDPQKPSHDPSLLPQLNEKVLVIKDLSPLLSMRKETLKTVMGDLRDAYDGFTDQGRGNLGKVSYSARFTLLAATTLAIDRLDTVEQELGERFIKFRGRANHSREKVRKAVANMGTDESMRQSIEQLYSLFLDSLPSAANITIPLSLQERLADLADFTAKARSHVARDRRRDVQYLPRPEVGTRLVKELGKLLVSLTAVRSKVTPDEQDFATVCRVAEDCLPPNRLAVINALRKASQPLRQSEVEKAAHLPHVTVARTLEDLELLGVVASDELPGVIVAGEQVRIWRLL